MAEQKEKEVIMVICDISGYTNFFVTNREDAKCAHAILTNLMGTIIKEVRIPLKISKLEGDAVFAYAVKGGNEAKWLKEKAEIKNKLAKFFTAFTKRLAILSGTNTCECNACQNMDALKLKTIVHSGRVFFQKIDRFYELSGLDAIIVHRLLKNSAVGNEYILFSEAALKDLGYNGEIKTVPGAEIYDHIGGVKTAVYYPPPQFFYAPSESTLKNYQNPVFRAATKLLKDFYKLMIAWKVIKLKKFNNLPEVKP